MRNSKSWDQLVEQGARARYEYQRERLPDREQPPWEELVPPIQSAYLHEAESVLGVVRRQLVEAEIYADALGRIVHFGRGCAPEDFTGQDAYSIVDTAEVALADVMGRFPDDFRVAGG